jgi:hypothetical protein
MCCSTMYYVVMFCIVLSDTYTLIDQTHHEFVLCCSTMCYANRTWDLKMSTLPSPKPIPLDQPKWVVLSWILTLLYQFAKETLNEIDLRKKSN